MSGNPVYQDNQFVNTPFSRTVYIDGPVSRVPIKPQRRTIDGFHPYPPQPDISIKPSRLRRPLTSPGFFQAVLLNSGAVIVATQKRHSRFSKLQIILLSLATACLLVGGYYSYIGIKSVKVSALQAANLTYLANKEDKKTTSTPGSTNKALSTTPITSSTLAGYVVAPNLPRYLIIPKLGVDARVLSVGVTSTGALGTPDNVYDTAWYNESAEPGQSGAMLIDGHVSSWTAHGVFYGLKTLVPGDTIEVERGDGTMFTYKVVKSQIYPSGNVNMQAAMTPIVSGQPGLNLITCTGDVIPGTSTFNERIIVFATQVS